MVIIKILFLNHSAIACKKNAFSFVIFSLKIVTPFLFKNTFILSSRCSVFIAIVFDVCIACSAFQQ